MQLVAFAEVVGFHTKNKNKNKKTEKKKKEKNVLKL